MRILRWSIDLELEKETLEHYRTGFAVALKDKEPIEIIRQITFDNAVRSIRLEDIENLFNFVDKKFLGGRLKGIGLEVGAGPATFSSVLARRNRVENMYAVEVCPPIVELLMPKVAGYILGDRVNKVIGAIGSFDDMELPDESVDFIFDFFSLHHSGNLERTMRECFRVLKKDGFILCFDKARPDYFTKNDLDGLLDRECSEKEKEFFGVPADRKLTRRMCGEMEYRLKDWLSAFTRAGFNKTENFHLAKTTGRSSIKRLFSFFPKSVQIRLNGFLPEPKFGHKFILSQQNKIFSRFLNPFPKEISLLVAYK